MINKKRMFIMMMIIFVIIVIMIIIMIKINMIKVGSWIALMSVRFDRFLQVYHGCHYGALAFQGINSCQVPICLAWAEGGKRRLMSCQRILVPRRDSSDPQSGELSNRPWHLLEQNIYHKHNQWISHPTPDHKVRGLSPAAALMSYGKTLLYTFATLQSGV